MSRKRKYEAQYLHRGKWWIAWTDDLPGAVTQGRTLEEARENLRDAIRLMLEPSEIGKAPASASNLVREVLVL